MNISKFSLSRFNYLLSISMLILIIALSSCSLNTSAIPPREDDPLYDPPPLPPEEHEGSRDSDIGTWSAAALPGYACLADNITLQWNVGDPLCPVGTGPSCQTLNVTDNMGLLDPPYSSRELTGSHFNGSVSSIDDWSGVNPFFTFSVVHDRPGDPGWINATSEVVIVQNPPAEPVARNFRVFSAGCDGDLGWKINQYRLDMTEPEFIEATKGLGPCVRITSVCYLPNDPEAKRPNPVIVSLVGGGPMAATTLSLGECADGLSLRPDLAYDVQPATPLVEWHEGNCIEGDVEGEPITDPPFTQLLFTFGCDTRIDGCGE